MKRISAKNAGMSVNCRFSTVKVMTDYGRCCCRFFINCTDTVHCYALYITHRNKTS